MGPCIRMIMKKVITLAATALALMFATDSYAQVIGKDIITKNEISVSYGTLSNSEWIEVFQEVVTVMFGGKTKQKSAVGPISAEYFYRVSPVVAVGAVGSIASYNTAKALASGRLENRAAQSNTGRTQKCNILGFAFLCKSSDFT